MSKQVLKGQKWVCKRLRQVHLAPAHLSRAASSSCGACFIAARRAWLQAASKASGDSWVILRTAARRTTRRTSSLTACILAAAPQGGCRLPPAPSVSPPSKRWGPLVSEFRNSGILLALRRVAREFKAQRRGRKHLAGRPPAWACEYRMQTHTGAIAEQIECRTMQWPQLCACMSDAVLGLRKGALGRCAADNRNTRHLLNFDQPPRAWTDTVSHKPTSGRRAGEARNPVGLYQPDLAAVLPPPGAPLAWRPVGAAAAAPAACCRAGPDSLHIPCAPLQPWRTRK